MKKGASLPDLMFVSVGFLTLSLTIILMSVFLSSFNDEWQGVDEITPKSKDLLNTNIPRYYKVLDNSFLFLAVCSVLALFFGAALLRTNPVFFLIGSLILAVMVLITMFIKDTYQAIMSTTSFAAAENNYIIIPFFMNNLPQMTVVTGFLIIIALYMKVKNVRGNI